MMGRLVEAEDSWADMLRLARDLQHPPSLASALAFVLHGGGIRHSYTGRMDRLLPIADELITLSREEDYFFWYADAYWYRGIIAEAMGDVPRARTQMREGRELFAQSGTRLSMVMMNVICAESLYRLGDDEEAFLLLDQAEGDMQARQEGLMAPEIWRVRGRLLARRGQCAAAEAAYLQAMKRARGQGALSLELRSAIDLYHLCAGSQRAEEARGVVAGLLRRFTQGLDRPEIARARAIVQSSSRESATTRG
jgi:tetratricopeptide (TPR) repeat protein